jgi:hypothetical protein
MVVKYAINNSLLSNKTPLKQQTNNKSTNKQSTSKPKLLSSAELQMKASGYMLAAANAKKRGL